MLIFHVGEFFAKLVLIVLPKRWSDRILENCGEMKVYVLATKCIKTKPRMTFVEGVFATILFDLALFGTSNLLIRGIIRLFTNLQNAWDTPFASKQVASSQVTEFCRRLSIQQEPWIWEKPKEEYTSLNDFFSRTYHPLHFPPLGDASVVSPACCTMTRFNNNADLQTLLIKGCNYQIQDIGLPTSTTNSSGDIEAYRRNYVFLGYLSPTDYHRVHSPIRGKCVYCKLNGKDKKSASVKFFGGKFNILNENKRLVIVLESLSSCLRVALVVIGGIGVDTIVFDPNMLNRTIEKGQELSAFRAGGSAIAMFSNHALTLTSDFDEASKDGRHVQVQVGESLANY